MEQTDKLLEVLERIEKANRRQVRLTRLLCVFLLVSALCCGAALLLVYDLLPQLTVIMDQLETVLSNLETTTRQLSALDLEGMVANVDTLVTTGQQSLEQTMQKVNSLDFETLNEAIKDLQAVIEPLARFFKAF